MSLPILSPSSTPVTPGAGVNVAVFADTNGFIYPVTLLTDSAFNQINGDGNGNLNVTMGSALAENIDSVLTYSRGTVPLPTSSGLSATGLVLNGAGKLCGVFVSAYSAGTLAFYDNASAASGNLLVPPFTPSGVGYIPLPNIRCVNGIYCGMASSPSMTVLPYYDPTPT